MSAHDQTLRTIITALADADGVAMVDASDEAHDPAELLARLDAETLDRQAVVARVYPSNQTVVYLGQITTCYREDEPLYTIRTRLTSASDLLGAHRQTGEPLSEAEVEQILEAGLASHDDFGDVGGGLYALRQFVTADDGAPLGPNEDPWGGDA